MKKILFFIIIVAVIFGGVKLFKTRAEQKVAQSTAQERYYAVDIVQAKKSTLEQHRSFLAEVDALKEVSVSTKISGTITHLHVSENSIVKKGDLLLDIDDAELRSSLKAAKEQKKAQLSDMKYTKSVLERNEKLYKAGGLSREKYEASLVMYQNKTALLETSVQKIKQIEAQLKYFHIKAPFSGVVSSILLHEGDMALPAKPILKLHSDEQKMVFKYIPNEKALQVNQAVLINEQKVAHITKLYDYVQNGLSLAEARFDTPLKLANHSLVNIEVVIKSQNGCSVPLSSILHQDDSTSVMEYKDGAFSPLHVSIVLQDHKEAIITPCPEYKVASASEAKLAILAALGKVKVSQ